jgi:hypothetical protein
MRLWAAADIPPPCGRSMLTRARGRPPLPRRHVPPPATISNGAAASPSPNRRPRPEGGRHHRRAAQGHHTPPAADVRCAWGAHRLRQMRARCSCKCFGRRMGTYARLVFVMLKSAVRFWGHEPMTLFCYFHELVNAVLFESIFYIYR